MRISDWSSDRVLFRSGPVADERPGKVRETNIGVVVHQKVETIRVQAAEVVGQAEQARGGRRIAVETAGEDRKSVVSGKRVSVRVDLGGRRIIKKKNHQRYLRLTKNQTQKITTQL